MDLGRAIVSSESPFRACFSRVLNGFWTAKRVVFSRFMPVDLFSFSFGLEMRENLVPEQRLRGLRGFDQRSFKRTAYVILGQAPDAWMMPCVFA